MISLGQQPIKKNAVLCGQTDFFGLVMRVIMSDLMPPEVHLTDVCAFRLVV